MYSLDTPALGIYEKALPPKTTWLEKLNIAKTAGYDFVELSIDESDERISRLSWNKEQRAQLVEAIQITGIRIPSMCLSVSKKYPLGN